MSYSVAKCDERDGAHGNSRFEGRLVVDEPSMPDGTNRDASGRARAATRAFDLLEFFQQTRRPARTTEIGRALGIPNSSADDLLRALLAKGYLSYNAQTKFYSPSYRLIHVSDSLMDGFPILDSLHEIEVDLRDSTGQTVVIAAQEGVMLRVVSVQLGENPSPKINVGALHPLARYHEKRGWLPTSNLASVILAANRDRDIVNILSELDEPGRLTNYLPLIERLRSIRTTGIAECQIRDSELASLACGFDRGSKLPVIAVGCVGEQKEVDRWRPDFRFRISNCLSGRREREAPEPIEYF